MGSELERYMSQLSGRPLQQGQPSQLDIYMDSLRAKDPFEEDEDIEEETFTQYLGNLAKYSAKIIFKNPYAQTYGPWKAPFEIMKSAGKGLVQVAKNIQTPSPKIKSAIEKVEKGDYSMPEFSLTPVKDLTKEVWSNFAGSVSGVAENPMSLPKGFLEMTIEPLLETLSGTTRIGDTPVISTVTERARAIQEIASIATAATGYAGTAALLRKKFTPLGAKALVEPSALKNLGQATLVNAGASAAAGGAAVATMEIGSDDVLTKAISGALSGIPLGMVLGGPIFEGIALRNAKIAAYAGAAQKYRTEALNDLVQDISAAHGLASSEKTPLQNLINNIDSFAKSEKRVEAIIRSSVDSKTAWIVPQVNETTLSTVTKGISHEAPTGPPLEWLDPPKGVKISNPTFFGMKVEWGSLFDKATYILSNLKSTAKSYPLIAEQITKKFNISLDDAIAHGMYVRQSIKNLISNGKIERLTQPEFDMVERGLINRGTKIISQLPDGGKITDYNNVTWTRVGNTMTDGKLTYPVNDNTIIKTIGRPPKKLDPLSGKIRLPALDFRPDYQRAVGDFHLYRHYTESLDPINTAGEKPFDLLVSPKKLDKNHAQFYEQTGFLPGEVVSLDGSTNARILQRGSKPNTFLVSTVKGGKGVRIVKASRLQHHPDGIRSAVEGITAFEATSTSMFEKYIQTFRKDYNKNLLLPENQLSFDNIMEKARIKSGIPEAEREGLRLATYRRIQDDFVEQLPEIEKKTFKSIRAELELAEEILMSNKTNQIHNYATTNGFYIRNKGGGSFEIRQAADDVLVHTFGSLDEGVNFLNKVGKNPLHSIDTDGNTVAPSALAEIGGLNEEYNGPASNWWNKGMERFQAHPITSIITSSQEYFHSLAATFDDAFGTGKYFKERIASWTWQNQQAAQALRRFHEYNSKEISAGYLKLKKALHNMKRDDFELMLGLVETLSPDQIKSGAFGRPTSTTEIRKAMEWANAADKGKFSMYDVESLFHAAEKLGGKAGTQEFEAAVQNLVKNGIEKGNKIVKANQLAANIVIDLGRLHTSTLVGQEPFTKFIALRLADAFQFPDKALTRAQYMTKHGIGPNSPIKIAADIFEETVGKITDLAGIPKTERASAYVPNIRLLKELNSWSETKMPEELMTRLSQAIIGDNQSMVRDPLTLVYRYLEEVGRHKAQIDIDGQTINYNQFINKSRAEMDKIATELNEYDAKTVGKTNAGNIFQDKAKVHLAEIQGRVDVSSKTRDFFKSHFKSLGYSDLSPGAITDLIASATQGASQIMWIRDVVSAGGIAYSLFGSEFARKAIFTPVNVRIIESLERRGKIPIVGAREIASPQSTRMSTDLSGKISKMADQALTASGQHHIYRHRLAGIYLATEEMVVKNANKLRNREISKKMFMDNINIDVHSRAVQTLFDKFISSGDVQAAVDYLAQQNTKRIMNLFGYANTPIGWTTSIGRVLGQYGSWGSNHIATALNSSRNLTSANGIKRMLRFSSYEGARLLAASAIGLNLNSFTLLPNLPGVGPVGDIVDEAQRVYRDYAGGHPVEALRHTFNMAPGVKITPDWEFTLTTDFGRLFVPYSFATENILKALIDLPNEGYSPLQQFLKGVGFRPVTPPQ